MILYQPKKLIDIAASKLYGEKMPFYKTCAVSECNRRVTIINGKWYCGYRLCECIICETIKHYSDMYYVCPSCDSSVCGSCTKNVGIGSGPLKCDYNYINVLQTVYNVRNVYANGILLSIDNMNHSTIYTFVCNISGLPNQIDFLITLKFYIIIEEFNNGFLPKVEIASTNPLLKT
jgi:hypothetical protein